LIEFLLEHHDAARSYGLLIAAGFAFFVAIKRNKIADERVQGQEKFYYLGYCAFGFFISGSLIGLQAFFM
jgi:hypothetical protein